MAHIVDLHTEVVHRHVFELRYPFGHLYWDRCGKVINELISSNPEWDFENIQGDWCHLVSREKNLRFNLSAAKFDLSQIQSADVLALDNAAEFSALAESFSQVVTSILQLSDFTRVGFRAWYLYPTADREESYRRVEKLKLLAPEIEKLNVGTVSEASCRLVIELPQHMVRFAVAPFEQPVDLAAGVIQAARAKAKDCPRNQRHVQLDKMKAERIVKSYPQFGVLVDMDAFIEEPPYPDEVSASTFISSAFKSFGDIKKELLEKR